MTSLRHVLAAAALALSATPAAASEWWTVANRGPVNYFVDVSSIRTVGDKRTAWIHAEAVGGVSAKAQYMMARLRFDCAEQSAQQVTMITYAADGKRIGSSELTHQPIHPPPGSDVWANLEFVCAYDPAKATGDEFGKAVRLPPHFGPSDFVAAIKEEMSKKR